MHPSLRIERRLTRLSLQIAVHLEQSQIGPAKEGEQQNKCPLLWHDHDVQYGYAEACFRSEAKFGLTAMRRCCSAALGGRERNGRFYECTICQGDKFQMLCKFALCNSSRSDKHSVSL
jgi:hypothetical protein